VDTVIGENRMDFVGHGRDKMAKEFGGNLGGRFLMQLGACLLRSALRQCRCGRSRSGRF
jgi:hypothetical protein